jgi:hypothetical protein
MMILPALFVSMNAVAFATVLHAHAGGDDVVLDLDVEMANGGCEGPASNVRALVSLAVRELHVCGASSIEGEPSGDLTKVRVVVDPRGGHVRVDGASRGFGAAVVGVRPRAELFVARDGRRRAVTGVTIGSSVGATFEIAVSNEREHGPQSRPTLQDRVA